MKKVIGVLVLLVGILTAVLINSSMIGKAAGQYAGRVLTEPLESVYEDFKKEERYIGLTVTHDDLSRIEENFAEGIGAHLAGDEKTEGAMRKKLSDSFLHLKRLTGINFDSIF